MSKRKRSTAERGGDSDECNTDDAEPQVDLSIDEFVTSSPARLSTSSMDICDQSVTFVEDSSSDITPRSHSLSSDDVTVRSEEDNSFRPCQVASEGIQGVVPSSLCDEPEVFTGNLSTCMDVSQTALQDTSNVGFQELSDTSLPGICGSSFLSDEEDSSEKSDYSAGTQPSSCATNISEESNDLIFSFENFNDPPVYSGAKISVNESMVAILSYAIRHKLNGKAIADLLDLISLHCGDESNLKTSLYSFKKYFANQTSRPNYHYFCSACLSPLPDSKSSCPNYINASHPFTKETCFFVELPLVPQVESVFANRSFCENFNHRFKRVKMSDENLEDIFDGQVYKEQIESGFLSEQFNFSLLLSSDGVPVFKSSTHGSLWPVYFSINELPYRMRVSKEYMLIGGLWYGKKPDVNVMLSPLVSALSLLRKGISVKLFGSTESITVRAVLLAATFDLPAKASFLGMKQFNGSFGCQICKIKGESVEVRPYTVKTSNKRPRKKTAWVYRYSKDLPLRQHAETLKFAKEVQVLLRENPTADVDVYGVKQPSIIFKIMYDVIRGVGVDELHAIYLGVTNKLMSLWFDSKFSKEPFSLRSYLNVIDGRLKKIRPPNFIQRGIRSISEDYAHWKGNEKKVWLLHLSLPVLKDIMKSKYLEHHALLVSSVHMLLSVSISPTTVLLCGRRFEKYVHQFETLYGVHHMTMNIHLLQHLSFVVNNLGPLWCYSCFPFESFNGDILSMIHGTRYIETQVASCVYLLSQLPHIVKELRTPHVKDFCSKILHPSCRLKKLHIVDDYTFSVGFKKEKAVLPPYALSLLQSVTGAENFETFHKLKKQNFLFESRSYCRSTRCVSYVVSFRQGGRVEFGVIDLFVRVCCNCQHSACSCNPKLFAIVEQAAVESCLFGRAIVPHIQKFTLTSNYVAVPVDDLESILFWVSYGTDSYISSLPNFVQTE